MLKQRWLVIARSFDVNAKAESLWLRRADTWQFVFLLLVLTSANLSIAVSQISMGAALALLFCKGFIWRQWPPKTGLEAPAIALALWALIMIPFSADSGQSAIFYRRFFLFSILWVAASLATTERRRYILAAAALAGAVAVSLVCEIQIFQRAGGLFTTRFMGASNSMTSGVLLMMAVLVGLSFLVVLKDQRKWRIVITAMVLLITLAMFQTMTRSAIMGLMAGIAAMILLVRPRVFIVFLLIIVLATVLIYSLGEQIVPHRFWIRISPEAMVDSTSSTGLRVEMWRGGWEMFKAQPIIGVGDCDLTKLVPEYYGDQTTRYFGHMHSNVVMWAVIWGVPGLIISHWFVLLPLVVLIPRLRLLLAKPGGLKRDPSRAAWVLAATAVLVGFYVAGLTEWYFGDAEAMSLYLSIIGIGLGQKVPTENTPDTANGQ
ncbi:MAG: O-antigen ligase [Candidatus Krumholzibacteriia bacterium]